MNSEYERWNKEYEIIPPWSNVWENLLRSEDKSTLQTVLKFRQISLLHRKELDAHIRYKINDPSVTSMFDHILLTHIIFGTIEEVQTFVKRHKLTVDYMTKLKPVRVNYRQLEQSNKELIRWLIDFGLDASGSVVDYGHMVKLPYEWNVYMLERGASCRIVDFEGIRSVEQFRQYWKYCDKTPQSVSNIMNMMFNRLDKIKDIRTNERKEFILNEYRATSSNNLFKKLPIEIIQKICSYEIDDVLWLVITDIMIKEVPVGSLELNFGWNSRIIALIPKFLWKYWDKFSEKTKNYTAGQILNVLIIHHVDDLCYESLLKFFRLPIMANIFPSPNSASASNILESILRSKHPKALDLLKVVVETQQFKPGDYRTPNSDQVPHVWYCLYSDNIPMIQYLIDIDSWPLQNEYAKFDDWINHRRPGLKAETLQSCLEYLKKKGKIDSNYGQ